MQTDGVKVIDVAMKYGYDSPDSFTKAFTRFHGITPAQGSPETVNSKTTFLKNTCIYKGGFEMECKIVKKAAFTVVGSAKIIKNEEGYKDAHNFGQSIMKRETVSIFVVCMESV